MNNTYKEEFVIPEVMPTEIIVWFRTNNFPNENSIEIVDVDNNVVYNRTGMSASTLYRDTVILTPGCYTYNVYDSDDDGIAFWANNDGSGYTRFQEVGGTIVKSFEGDFGGSIHYNFTAGSPLSYEEIHGLETMEVHPNPTTDELNVSLRGFEGEVTIELVNTLGTIVQTETIHPTTKIYEGTLSLKSLESGMYVLRATDGTTYSSTKVIKE